MHRLLLLLSLAVALPASSQVVSSTTIDLTNGGAFDPDAECAIVSDATVAWFDGDAQALYVYSNEDAPPVAVFYTAADIDAAAGVDADRCRAAAYDATNDVLYAVLSTSDNVDFVLAFAGYDGEDAQITAITSPTSGAGDGITGLTVAGDRLYAAVSEFFNDPPDGGASELEDGIYSFALDLSAEQMPTEVATLSDLSLTSLSASADGTRLFATSNRFGAGDYQSVIVEIDLDATPPGISVFADPFDGTVFSVPTNSDRFDLDALVVASDGTSEAVFVLNNNFDGPEGEEIARYGLDGAGTLFATQTSLLADLGRTEPGFTPGGGPNTLLYDAVEDDLYILNSGAFGGADEVLIAASGFATASERGVPSEVGAFDVGPNPFTDRLGVVVSLVRPQDVTVAVFDVLGREVAVLHRGGVGADQRLALAFDGRGLPAGTYLVRLTTETGVATRAITLAR